MYQDGKACLQSGVLYPGLLGDVGHLAEHVDDAPRPLHLAQQGRQQGRLAGADSSDHSGQRTLRYSEADILKYYRLLKYFR